MCELNHEHMGLHVKYTKQIYKRKNIHKNHGDKYPRQTVSEKQVFIFALYNWKSIYIFISIFH